MVSVEFEVSRYGGYGALFPPADPLYTGHNNCPNVRLLHVSPFPSNLPLSARHISYMALPPQMLRIKRKRCQDPLQALILEDLQRHKRSKPSSPILPKTTSPVPEARSWFFQLSGTDDKSIAPDADVLAPVLAEASSSQKKRQFVIPKAQTEEDTVITNELSDMLNSFLHVGNSGALKKKRRGGKPLGSVGIDGIDENYVPKEIDVDQVTVDPEAPDEYVFDVYRLSLTEPLTNANYPQSQIGYIRFFDDEEYELMQSDDENKSHTQIYSDDEDSNAESFYQNDYPDDEDAGTYSDTYEAGPGESEDDPDDDNIGPVIIDLAEDAEGHAHLQGHEQADFAESLQFDSLYDEFFDENDTSGVDFLQQQEDVYSEVLFERQTFFEGEEDDDMAIHRDRIFGKLQRIINEEGG